MEERQSFRNVELATRSDGDSTRYLSLSGKPLFDARGAFAGYRGTAADITGRKLAEKALADSEARLRAALDGAAVGFLVVDEQGVIELVNPAAEQIFGYSKEEVLGQSVSRLMPDSPADGTASSSTALIVQSLSRSS